MNGWLFCAVSHGVPSALVTLGTLKKVWALTGHPGCTLPFVSSTSKLMFTPWKTHRGDAAMAMSGGLQPWAKYGHVMFDPCMPMKLCASAGVAELAADDPLLLLLAPPVLLTRLCGPLPLGHITCIALSSPCADAVPCWLPAGDTV